MVKSGRTDILKQLFWTGISEMLAKTLPCMHHNNSETFILFACQPLADSPPRTPDSTAGQKTPLTRTKSLILTPFSSWKKTIRSKVRRSFRRRQLKGLQDYNLPHFSQDVQSHLEGRRKKVGTRNVFIEDRSFCF